SLRDPVHTPALLSFFLYICLGFIHYTSFRPGAQGRILPVSFRFSLIFYICMRYCICTAHICVFCAITAPLCRPFCAKELLFLPPQNLYTVLYRSHLFRRTPAGLDRTEECTMARVYNFSAGPSMLPEPVLRKAQAELLDYHGSGQSVMEMSHRSKWFEEIIQNTEASLRRLMQIPDNYKIGFFQ